MRGNDQDILSGLLALVDVGIDVDVRYVAV